MDVIEITRQLGVALQQDETYIKYAIAKEKNDQDKDLQNLIGEFNLLRLTLNNELNNENKDDEKIKEINQKLKDCYNTIMQNKSMAAFNNAKNELDTLIKKINAIIELSIKGEDPLTCEPDTSCSGSCSSCSGCH